VWLCTAALLALVSLAQPPAFAWGSQGHRLVALLATARLTPVAGQNVTWLLDGRSLADVSTWADQYLTDVFQTSYWHYLNIPPSATRYDRSRDCPRQPGTAEGGRGDTWRDCAVDRILYSQERLRDATLDRADRAVALKFLVHLAGDLHQPFHALGVGRGGNDIPVKAFGSPTCANSSGASYPCNLHGIWDTTLIAHRGLDDREYLLTLENLIKQRRWNALATGTSADWAMQSHALAKAALVPAGANVDEPYYRKQIPVVDERLALAGLRLAAMLNDALRTSPQSPSSRPAPAPAPPRSRRPAGSARQ
jgi:hypothetical protein